MGIFLAPEGRERRGVCADETLALLPPSLFPAHTARPWVMDFRRWLFPERSGMEDPHSLSRIKENAHDK